MFKSIYILLFFTPVLVFSFIDITQEGYEQYQDIIINGQVAKKANYNHKHCQDRYAVIEKILEKYNRPFTLLDIGAAQGYYSLKAAYKFKESTFVMLEGNNPAYPKIGDQLRSICEDNTKLNNIIFLNRSIFLEDLKKIATCEHFDVVLALNIVHWFPAQYKEIIDVIISLGKDIIFETPPFDEIHLDSKHRKQRKDIYNYLIKNNAQLLKRVPRHAQDGKWAYMFLVKGKRNNLKRKSWIHKEDVSNTHFIISNYDSKFLKKFVPLYNRFEESLWTPGINLITYLLMNGEYPSRTNILNEIYKLRNIDHNDWMLNNMIVTGNSIQFIDFEDPNHTPLGIGGGKKFSEKLYLMIVDLFSIRDRRKFEKKFYKVASAQN